MAGCRRSPLRRECRIPQHAFLAAMAAQVEASDKSDMGRRQCAVNARAFMAMRDMSWKLHLNGPDHEAIMKAYKSEWSSLIDETGVLVELDPSHPKYRTAVAKATSGRCILEFKRVGTWKCRVVVRGYEEDKVALDGPDFIYAANVCELASVRNLLFTPRECLHGATSGTGAIF